MDLVSEGLAIHRLPASPSACGVAALQYVVFYQTMEAGPVIVSFEAKLDKVSHSLQQNCLQTRQARTSDKM